MSKQDIVDRLRIGFPRITDHEPPGYPMEVSRAWRAEAKEAAAEIERLRDKIAEAWRDGYYEGAAQGDDLIGGTVEKWSEEYAKREVQP